MKYLGIISVISCCIVLGVGCGFAADSSSNVDAPNQPASNSGASGTAGSSSVEWDAGAPMDGGSAADGGTVVSDASIEDDAGVDRDNLPVAVFASESEELADLSEEVHMACLPESTLDAESCSQSDCHVLRSCCIGDSDCCEAVTIDAIPRELNLSACVDEDVAACFTDLGYPADNFGPEPCAIHPSGFYPAGDEQGQSGIQFEQSIDLTYQKIEVSASFHPVQSCDADCLEGVGIGFFTGDQLPSHVAYDAALIYSGSLQQMRLVIGGSVIAQSPVGDTAEKWLLRLLPSGQIQAYRGDDESTLVFQAPFEPKPDAKLMLFGHNADPSEETGAHLSDISIHTELCDIPDQWQQRTAITLLEPDGNPWQPDVIASPSVAYNASGDCAMVFEVEGAIHFARCSQSEPYVFTMQGYSEVPALDSRTFDDESIVALRDPFLLSNGQNWSVYFAVEHQTLASFIAYATTEDGEEFSAYTAIEFDDVRGDLDSPTIYAQDSQMWVMIVREHAEKQRLVTYQSYDRERWVRHTDSPLEEMTTRPLSEESGLFDRDEIDAPHISVHNGAWHLYYTGRRGSRWYIGLLVSDNLVRWRRVPESEPSLAPSISGFERHSLSDPHAIYKEDVVELYYVASDGFQRQIAKAIRSATDNGTRGPDKPLL